MRRKILIANRGEIARRIIRAVKQLGHISVVVYSDYDKEMPFVTEADEAYSLGEGSLSNTYLNIEKIIEIAQICGASAIHPGYGFLSENANLAKACHENKIIFIGPTADVISLMGNKIEARALVESIDLPVIKGISGNRDTLLSATRTFQYPLLVKAAQGGGGKGMIRVEHASDLSDALDTATRQAKNYFGDQEIFVEELIPRAKHIEVQVMADHHGNVVHLYERECTLQRRYQKIIEEAPSPSIDDETREKITRAAVDIAKTIKYTNAGTIEFLMDENKQFYFLEMNTRVQVEHPVTEMITHIDIVKEQINIAFDRPLSFRQNEVNIKGHAIETRVNAEDPFHDLSPSTGRITAYEEPDDLNIRVDGAVEQNNTITPHYDSMISKVISWGMNRNDAVKTLRHALGSYLIDGVFHSIPYLQHLIHSPVFEKSTFTTSFIDHHGAEIQRLLHESYEKYLPVAIIIAALLYYLPQEPEQGVDGSLSGWRNVPRYNIVHDNKSNEVFLTESSPGLFKASLNGELSEVSLKVHQKNSIVSQINGQHFQFRYVSLERGVHLFYQGMRYDLTYGMSQLPKPTNNIKKNNQSANLIISPLHGKVIKVNVKERTKISKGETLFVIESMKMENKVLALSDATVKAIHVEIGQQVDNQTVLLTMDA